MSVKLSISKVFLQSGETALHQAIASDQVDAVLFLLDNGADPTLKLNVSHLHYKVKFIIFRMEEDARNWHKGNARSCLSIWFK